MSIGKRFLFLVILVVTVRVANAQFSLQNCVVERFTGSWVTYEPDAYLYLDTVIQHHPRAIPVAVHVGDSMEINDGIMIQSFYTLAYPTATMNRNDYSISRSLWDAQVTSILSNPSTATMYFDSVIFSTASRQLDVYLRVFFTGTESGNMRFNCIVVEDSVYGSGTGYNQNNAYNSVVGHPFYNAGNPIVNYCHRFVARAYLGGAFGTPGIIPSTVSFASSYQCHYTYTVPANYNEHRIKLVGLVSKYEGSLPTDRYIINAEAFDLDTAQFINLGTGELVAAPLFEMYPNPASDYVVLKFQIVPSTDVLNLVASDGRTVRSYKLNLDADLTYSISIEDLAPGIYFFNCGSGAVRFMKYNE